jgi:hypothetical protein
LQRRDIAANALGSLDCDGVFDVVKVTGAITNGDAIYWDVDGDPVGGTAGTGAAGGTSTIGNLIGVAVAAATETATTVRVKLTAAKRTATIAGSVTADDITGSDATLTVGGLGAAQGGAITIVGGTSSTGGNAGGAVSVVGGVPGATGAGGAASLAGGAGGATSGTGGAAAIAGGAGPLVTQRWSGDGSGGNAHGSGYRRHHWNRHVEHIGHHHWRGKHCYGDCRPAYWVESVHRQPQPEVRLATQGRSLPEPEVSIRRPRRMTLRAS